MQLNELVPDPVNSWSKEQSTMLLAEVCLACLCLPPPSCAVINTIMATRPPGGKCMAPAKIFFCNHYFLKIFSQDQASHVQLLRALAVSSWRCGVTQFQCCDDTNTR